MRILALWISGALALSGVQAAAAQTYPDRPVRIILAVAAGSVSDVIARSMASKLSTSMKQQFYVENRGGASGILAAQACARAEPDGYTICGVSQTAQVFNPLMFDKIPYDPDKDFTLITRLYFLTEAVAVSPSLGVNSIDDLMRLAKSKPAALNFGTFGPGSPPDLFLKWLNNQWGTAIVGVPFSGGGPIAQALAAKHIELASTGLGNFLGLAQAGQIKLLAVNSSERSRVVPDVPTFKEAGLGGYSWNSWWGMVAPAGVSKNIAERLNAEIGAILRDSSFISFLQNQSAVAAPTSIEDYASFVVKDREIAGALIKLANSPARKYVPEK